MENLMQCPDDDALRRYASGVAAGVEQDGLARHVVNCTRCQQRLSSTTGCDTTHLGEAATAEFNTSQPTATRGASDSDLPLPPPLDELAPSRIDHSARLRLGPYLLGECLGRGGMGCVYRATHSRLDKAVAIKLLPGGRLESPGAVERFQREMKALGRLQHPNLVQATDAGEAEGVHFLVMELVDGIDLAQLMTQSGSLPVAVACELARQTALGLQYAHEHALVHRDIKPSNVMLTASGTVKLLDLGLARLIDQTAGEITEGGMVMGTADYMAPEQAHDSRSADARSDLYALGCTLFKLLTGHAPYEGPAYDSPLKKLIAHASAPIPRLESAAHPIPVDVARLVQQLLRKEPDQRPATAQEVAERLAPFASGADLVRFTERILQQRNTADPATPGNEMRSSAQESEDPTASSGSPRARLKNWRSVSVALILLAAAMFAGVVFYFHINGATVRVTVDETLLSQGLTIKLDDDAVTIKQLGKPIRISPGDHELIVEHDGLQLRTTQPFTLERGGKIILSVTQLNGNLAVVPNAPDAALAAVANTSGTKDSPAAWGGERFWLGTWRPGGPAAVPGILPRPAKVPGLESWQLETTFPRHAVRRVKHSRDGAQLAVGSTDGVVRIYDANSLQCERCLLGHRTPVTDVGWSPDGTWLATCGGRESVRLWSTDTGQAGPVLAHRGIMSLAWAPDSQRIAITGWFQGVLIWDTHHAELAPKKIDADDQGSGGAVAWSPDGKLIAVLRPEQHLRILDADSGAIIQQLPGRFSDGNFPHVIAWSPDSRQIAVPDESMLRVQIFDVTSGDRVLKTGEHAQAITSVDWSTHYLASGSIDGEIALWDPMAGTLKRRSKTEHWAQLVSIAPSGERLAVGNWHRGVQLYDTVNLHLQSEIGIGSPWFATFTALAWHPDSARLATISGTSNASYVWNARQSIPPQVLKSNDKPLSAIAWHSEGNQLALGDTQGTIRVLDESSGASWIVPFPPNETLSEADATVRSLAWQPHGDLLASATRPPAIHFWNPREKHVTQLRRDGRKRITSVAWRPQGDQCAAIDASGQVSLWSADGKLERKWNVSGNRICWIHDGEQLAVWSSDSAGITILDPAAGPVSERTDLVGPLAWLSMRNGLLAGRAPVRGVDKPGLALFDLEAQSIEELDLPGGLGQSLAVSADGRLLAYDTPSAVCHVCDTATYEPLWLIIMLPDNRCVRVTAAGEVLDAPAEQFESDLVCVITSAAGQQETLTLSEFQARVAHAR